MKLGVNIDHAATLRQARKEDEPDLLILAQAALDGGADGITLHLREDRRHIQDSDVLSIRKHVNRLNLEMALSEEIVHLATQIRPEFCCLVPERREEVTTEGGLDVLLNQDRLAHVIPVLHARRIQVSIFIDPDHDQIRKAADLNADYIEIHTGAYANAWPYSCEAELEKIRTATGFALSLGLKVNAGHGLKYYNVRPVAAISGIEELNIGHSILSRALLVGMRQAVSEMKAIIGEFGES